MKLILFFLLSTMCVPSFAQLSKSIPAIDFNRDVKPLLSDRCFLCHGPDEGTREADLRLDTVDGAMTVIEAGDGEGSELIYRIMAHDSDQMPPVDSNLSLTAEEKEILKRWIDEGAKWQQHWAFVAPIKAKPPETNRKDWASNEIDQFVLARLETGKLSPAPLASKAKLLRRVSFDLTGLPPTLAELDAYLGDESETAYEKAVDRLLASSSYGERMTADWLDVARYSDTYGYQVDRDRFVWPWRDWVVGSFNKNMPYDQFLTEQIAGDLLPNATDDQVLATTFNRLHPQKVEGGSVEEEFRVEYVADRSQTVGMAFMGLTVECARCHDHKYDPISQKEYYQLFSFFNNIDESGLYSFFDAGAIPTPTMLLTNDEDKATLDRLRAQVRKLEASVAAEKVNADGAFRKWLEEFDVAELPEVLPGLILAEDFTGTDVGANEIVDGPHGSRAVQLTGDDEVRLESGDFKRHQPFSIAARLMIPADESVLKRSVVFHRSRAWTDSASRGYQLLIKEGRLSASLIHFWPGNAISIETVDPVETGKWFHVSMTYDGSSRANGIQLLIDGKRVPTRIVRDNLLKQIVGSGTDRLVLGARFRDVGFKNGRIAELDVFDRALSKIEVAHLAGAESLGDSLQQGQDERSADRREDTFEYFLGNHCESYSAKLARLATARKRLNAAIDQTNEIMVMREMETQRPAFVLARGAYDSPTDPVQPNTPSVFPPITNESESPNRLHLARWLSDPNHPLTARVAVNHYWQLCFGEGLVRTPEDFGSQGQPPTHPELLDWLAVDFQENGWDIKRLLKQIVLSRTYQQSTAASDELLELDPDNQLLARSPTYRLPAEMLRDNVLFSSGLLVDKLGGPPVRPYELEKSFDPSKPDVGEGLYRRSLYTYWKRTGPAPVMLTLDAAKRDVCQVKRERTSSPLAALVQLNNPQTVEASRKLAERMISKHDGKVNKVAVDLFRVLTSRFPTERERIIVESLFDDQRQYFKEHEKACEEFLAVGESKSETEDPVKLAAWASVANTLFSFDECVMKR